MRRDIGTPIGTCPCGTPAYLLSGRCADPRAKRRPYFALIGCESSGGHIVQPREWFTSEEEARAHAVARWKDWAERARTRPEWAEWRAHYAKAKP